jgi:hypothetical protein
MVDVNSEEKEKSGISPAIVDCSAQLQSQQHFSALDALFTYHDGCVHVSRVEPDTKLKKKFDIQTQLLNHAEQR